MSEQLPESDNNQPEETPQPEGDAVPLEGGLDFNVLDEAEEAVQTEGVETPITDHSPQTNLYSKEQAIEEIVANAPLIAEGRNTNDIRTEADNLLQSWADQGHVDPALGYAENQVTEAKNQIYSNLIGQSAVSAPEQADAPAEGQSPARSYSRQDALEEIARNAADLIDGQNPAGLRARAHSYLQGLEARNEANETLGYSEEQVTNGIREVCVNANQPEEGTSDRGGEAVPSDSNLSERETPVTGMPVAELPVPEPVAEEQLAEASESYEETPSADAPVDAVEETAPAEGSEISDVVAQVEAPPSDPDDGFDDVTNDVPEDENVEVAEQIIDRPSRYTLLEAALEISDAAEDDDIRYPLLGNVLSKLKKYAESGVLQNLNIGEDNDEKLIEQDNNGVYSIRNDFVNSLKAINLDMWENAFGIPNVYTRERVLEVILWKITAKKSCFETEEIEKSASYAADRVTKNKSMIPGGTDVTNAGYFDAKDLQTAISIAYLDLTDSKEKSSKGRAKGMLKVGLIMFGVGVGTVYLTDYLMERQDEVDDFEDQQVEIYKQKFNINQNNQLDIPEAVSDIVVLGQNVSTDEIHARGYFLDGSIAEKVSGNSAKEMQELHAKALIETNKRCAEAYQITVDNNQARIKIYKVK